MSDNYEQSANAADVEAQLKADWMGANWSELADTNLKPKSTSISRDTACYVADALAPSVLPSDFVVHKKQAKIPGDRAGSVLNDGAVDWGTAVSGAAGCCSRACTCA